MALWKLTTLKRSLNQALLSPEKRCTDSDLSRESTMTHNNQDEPGLLPVKRGNCDFFRDLNLKYFD